MNNKLRTEANNDFEKDFFKLMDKLIFEKTMENVRKHRDKLVITNKRWSPLVVETNYHTRKRFSEWLLAIEMSKTKVKMNKPGYLGLSVLEVSKTRLNKFRLHQITVSKQRQTMHYGYR